MKSILLLLCASVGALGDPLQATAAAREPNVILILADDLGYGDLGCYGHPSIRTPNLDRLAAQGMRFTDFYAAAEVCTPSRAALLTGRYPIRNGMCHDRFRVLRRNAADGLSAGEITLAELLQARGYATACIGKWHLGNYENNPAHHPRRHGFDFYFGLPHSNDMNPTPGTPKNAPSRLDQQAEWWAAPLYRNEQLAERPADQTTLTRRYTSEAVQFIREHRRRPFFLYFAHTFPHVPLFASQPFRGASSRGLYGDGVDMTSLLFGRGPGQREVFFYYRGAQLYAVRQGPFKAHYLTQSAYGPDLPEKHDPPMLFNLAHDPSERFNVATNHPAALADIAKAVEEHRAQLVPAKSQLVEVIQE